MTSAQSNTLASAEQRVHIRARLDAGTLPRRAENQRIYGGYGEDQPCDCCGHCIGRTEVEYEIQIPGNSSLPEILAMHLRCFEAWVTESRSTEG